MHWIDTLKIAFPIKVAPKKTPKGIKNYPQINPAKSNKGFGIDANKITTRNAWDFKFLYNQTFALSNNDSLSLDNLLSLYKSYNSSCF